MSCLVGGRFFLFKLFIDLGLNVLIVPFPSGPATDFYLKESAPDRAHIKKGGSFDPPYFHASCIRHNVLQSLEVELYARPHCVSIFRVVSGCNS
jgi:hypothetical protein